jgi:hypothetical protein
MIYATIVYSLFAIFSLSQFYEEFVLEGGNEAQPTCCPYNTNLYSHIVLYRHSEKRKIFEFSTTIICKSLNKNEKICTKSNENRVGTCTIKLF